MNNTKHILVEELLETCHLNVEKRKQLNQGKITLSKVENVITKKLMDVKWFPTQWRSTMPFSGALIEYSNEKLIKLYLKAEISLAVYKVIKVEEYKNIKNAIVKLLEFTFGDNIDGVPIDYKN